MIAFFFFVASFILISMWSFSENDEAYNGGNGGGDTTYNYND